MQAKETSMKLVMLRGTIVSGFGGLCKLPVIGAVRAFTYMSDPRKWRSRGYI
jgi:hypothetical protein